MSDPKVSQTTPSPGIQTRAIRFLAWGGFLLLVSAGLAGDWVGFLVGWGCLALAYLVTWLVIPKVTTDEPQT
jgi:phage shock protein PspC (stress-responsive transcriptional regulator)